MEISGLLNKARRSCWILRTDKIFSAILFNRVRDLHEPFLFNLVPAHVVI